MAAHTDRSQKNNVYVTSLVNTEHQVTLALFDKWNVDIFQEQDEKFKLSFG